MNGKREGFGKYYYTNGDYYEGQWKNGYKHGKGKVFYENGTIKYEGEWIYGERERFEKKKKYLLKKIA